MYKIPLEVSMSIMVPKWCNWSLLKVLSHFSFSIYLYPSSKGVISISFFSECAQISLSSPELIYYIYIFLYLHIFPNITLIFLHASFTNTSNLKIIKANHEFMFLPSFTQYWWHDLSSHYQDSDLNITYDS